MIPLYQLVSPPSQCGYLPDRRSSLEYVFVAQATTEDYQAHLLKGWRRFGRAFFHPVCRHCHACQSVRVPVKTFEHDRSQRRALKANADVELVIGQPVVTEEKLRLYDRFHKFQSDEKGWPTHDPKDPQDYAESFVD